MRRAVESDTPIAGVARTIQLVVGPVFLLSAVGGMLVVLTSRLARIMDRARSLDAKAMAAPPGQGASMKADALLLSRRARLINAAITLCTLTALTICAVVASLFLSAFLGFDAAGLIATLFVGAMALLFSGLLCFLREIFLGTASLRIGSK